MIVGHHIGHDVDVYKRQAFGGSATITLFEPGRVRLAGDLVEQSQIGRELYARMGSAMGAAAAG